MFDDGLELSGPTEHSGIMGNNGQSVELRPRGSAAGGKSTRSIRRQTWNREEASLVAEHPLHRSSTRGSSLPLACLHFYKRNL